jgi:hypothetical protein
MRVGLLFVVGSLVASPALPGKKKRAEPAASAEAAPAAEAPPAVVLGPEVGCWVAPGARQAWQMTTDAGFSSRFELVVRAVDGDVVTLELAGDAVMADTADPTMKVVFEAMGNHDVVPLVRWDRAESTYTLINIDEVVEINRLGVDAAFATTNLPPELVAQVRTSLLTPDMVNETWTAEALLLTQFTCATSAVGTWTYPQRVLNPVAGGFLPAVGVMTVTLDGPNLIVDELVQVDDAQWQAHLDAQLVSKPAPPELVAALRALVSQATNRATVEIATGLVTSLERETYRSFNAVVRQAKASYTAIAVE